MKSEEMALTAENKHEKVAWRLCEEARNDWKEAQAVWKTKNSEWETGRSGKRPRRSRIL